MRLYGENLSKMKEGSATSEPDVEEQVSADSRMHVGRWTRGRARGAGSMGNVWQEGGVGPSGLPAWSGDPPCALWQANYHTGVQFRQVLMVFRGTGTSHH